MTTNVKRERFFAQSQLFEMGFTKGLIKKYLPEPVTKENPMYRKAAPMKLWKESDVLPVMETDEFKTTLANRDKRKKAARKAIGTKIDKLLEFAQELANDITVTVIDDKELIERTLTDKQEWYEMNWSCREVHSVNEETLNRWVVNYIRHNLVLYDEIIRCFNGSIGKEEAYCLFKNCVLDKIAEAYPKYADACECQKIY